MITILVNNSPVTIEKNTNINLLLAKLDTVTTNIAVAINFQVIPRKLWSTTVLQKNDKVDIITAVAGG